MNKIIVVLIILISVGCFKKEIPRQHAFPKIEFPKHQYQNFHAINSPFSFDIPLYSELINDSSNKYEKYWYNLNYKPFDATLHMSYRKFNDIKMLDSLIYDTRKLAYKHTIKAEAIDEIEIKDSNGRQGIYYVLRGETATSLNFFLTDDQSQFFRGALYFNGYTTIDSVGPVVDFLQEDIKQLVKSFKF